MFSVKLCEFRFLPNSVNFLCFLYRGKVGTLVKSNSVNPLFANVALKVVCHICKHLGGS